VYTHHIWRPQGGSSHGAGPWATVRCVVTSNDSVTFKIAASTVVTVKKPLQGEMGNRFKVASFFYK
jgi:hypothetical protein